MSEPTSPQTPEAATPYKRQHLIHSAGYWFEGSRKAQRDGKSAEAVSHMENAYNHVENALFASQEELATLQTQLAERREAMAEQDRVNLELRKSLEVAETREDELNGRVSWLEGQREIECHQKENALAESGACLKEATELRLALFNKNCQLTEAQAACVAKDQALKKLVSYNVDVVAGRINYRPEDHIEVAAKGLEPSPVTDLLKRLADAERARSDMEWLEKNMGHISNSILGVFAPGCRAYTIHEAIHAARTQPKP